MIKILALANGLFVLSCLPSLALKADEAQAELVRSGLDAETATELIARAGRKA